MDWGSCPPVDRDSEANSIYGLIQGDMKGDRDLCLLISHVYFLFIIYFSFIFSIVYSILYCIKSYIM